MNRDWQEWYEEGAPLCELIIHADNGAQQVALQLNEQALHTRVYDNDLKLINYRFNVAEDPSAYIPGCHLRSYPNPFDDETNISFVLTKGQEINFVIFNEIGEIVDRFEGNYEAGINTLTWNPANTHKTNIRRGIYFLRLTGDDFTENAKMIYK